ncbi:MAG: family 78 glycoside hydrolase catalytic domain [Prolixibacteraceae bacterium]|nr:family 78 glycoside hydrolase catalytic domain [Prolixibacteraceae bacterium]
MKNLIILLAVLIAISSCSKSKITPVKLSCEYLENPAIVDVVKPRLAWINVANKGDRGQFQTAYQVRVASAKNKLSDPNLWDSDKVESVKSFRVEYNGKKLESRQECWWQVRTWDKEGNVSKWSEPGFWRMGLLDNSDWQAHWIGAPWQGEEAMPKLRYPGAPLTDFPPPAPLMRKEFSVNKKVEKAVVFVTGLGYFELYLNGKKVGNDELVPNQTNYGKRPNLPNENIPLPDNFRKYKVMYLAYDVKDQLQQGNNAIGSILGNGFYNAPMYWTGSYGSPRFLCQLYITYSDGTEDIIVSDPSWKASESAIISDLVYQGEHYDARKEQPGWCTPGFDDSGWEPVVLRKAPEGELVAQTAHSDKVTKKIAPVNIKKLENGNFLVDFGVEISGRLRLNNVEGSAGHKIEIKYNSNLYSGDNSYIFKGEGPESYASRFNWFVFSSVEISNWQGELKPEQLTAEAVNTEIENTAVFETSNPLFNEINQIWKRSQLDNMHGGIASDCPHRERSPYTGDGQVACVTVMHNFDAKNFYHKWIQDIYDAQNPETGYVPNGAPWQPGCGGGVAWGAAMCIMPWEFYLQYGAKDILEDNYEGMKGYVNYMQTWVDEDGIMFSQRTGLDGKVLKWFNLGEWCTPGEQVPDEMVHTFFLWRCADFTAKAAKALGKENEAKEYTALAEKTRQAFMKKYYDEEKGSYGNHGGNIFALKMGVPAEQYDQVVAALKADIKAADGHLDTGIFGTQFFFEVLAENGLQKEAYEAMNKKTEPSIGRWIELGSTTTREQWDESGSFNHPMFGGGLTWFYRKLAGMQTNQEQPGYKHIIFRPQPVKDLDFVTYSNLTPYGEAGIHWENGTQSFSMDVTVPVGSHATVYVPAKNTDLITESGKQTESAVGVKFLNTENGYAVFEVESGKYHFETVAM